MAYSSYFTIVWKGLIRPGLEHASIIWSPWLQKDITALEKCQRRCLRFSNEEIRLLSLKSGRDNYDMVETYKFLSGDYKTNPEIVFSQPEKALRGHELKLFKQYSSVDCHKYFFCNGVVNRWNGLPQEAISALNVANFKQNLRAFAQGREG